MKIADSVHKKQKDGSIVYCHEREGYHGRNHLDDPGNHRQH